MGSAINSQAPGYEPVSLSEKEELLSRPLLSHGAQPSPGQRLKRKLSVLLASCAVSLSVFVAFNMLACNGTLFGIKPRPSEPSTPQAPVQAREYPSSSSSEDCPCKPTSTVPEYFNTSPGPWVGKTATGKAPFMAQTRTFDHAATYVPNAPLQTQVPVQGWQPGNLSIFAMMGFLTPYTPSTGFGVDEWPLPEGAKIIWLQMVSRHGSRYPTRGSNVEAFGARLANATGKFNAMGELEFLNNWKYQMGMEILVPRGRQELFDSGVLHAYMYSSLYDPKTKIIARTTTQDRMMKSAENFLAGMFGLEWTNNVTLEVIIEGSNLNNSLAGYMNCPNESQDSLGSEARDIWVGNYLKDATERFSKLVTGYNWTVDDTYAAQTLCAYDTVANGYSRFCSLFTYQEWIGFGYSHDLQFYGNNAFGSRTGRAVGIGFQQEVLARLQNHTIAYSDTQLNTTLDNNTVTFPLNQSLYLDFSHDTNIVSILAAFGLTQFEQDLPTDVYPGDHNFTVSHITPFGARLDVEIIKTPKPVKADRSGYEDEGEETKYVHFVLNQRTVPLGWSHPECDAERVDGWCEFETFLKVQKKMPGLARYAEVCFAEGGGA
ncbi:histidine phosphatase superfamily [Copromyces sp. CBS 386.78]|nr:histidine phosphatase superfamily [Copromyces sp. CBS 386.78]